MPEGKLKPLRAQLLVPRLSSTHRYTLDENAKARTTIFAKDTTSELRHGGNAASFLTAAIGSAG
jgi:hypothetical protein